MSRNALIEEPVSFQLEDWERHLADLKRSAAQGIDAEAAILSAEAMIERLRRGAPERAQDG